MKRTASEARQESRPHDLLEIERLLGTREIARARELAVAFRPRSPLERVEAERLLAQIDYVQGADAQALARLVKALRMTRGLPEARVHVRGNLADVLLRLGRTERANDQLRRALAEVKLFDVARAREPWLLSAIALIQRRRGMIGFAIETYERALALGRDVGADARSLGAIANNLALALIDHAEVERANRVLASALEAGDALPPSHRAGIFLTSARLGIHVGDPLRCREALARAEELIVPADLRATFLLDLFRTDLALIERRLDDATTNLERLFLVSLSHLALSDLVSSTSRRLAEVLLQLGRTREALERASLAVRHGRTRDVQEWAASLRVAGECEAALGRDQDARNTLAEAYSVLAATDCEAEKRRLGEALRRLSKIVDSRPSKLVPTEAMRFLGHGTREAHRLALRDGRTFLSLDAELIAAIHRAGEDRLPVLIVGETGTGKELVAQLVHELGPAREAPFVVVDCATLPEGLAEAELFGATRGAFSGAIADRVGLAASAEGGTLFLDELPELTVPLQGKLLRLLQDGGYRRVGESRMRRVRARFIAATNRDPESLMALGQLKPDLFYRLNGHRISLRPLRDRIEEIPMLVTALAREARLEGITPAAIARLMRHTWPGNVRELEMLIRVLASRAGRGAWLDESLLVGLVDGAPSASVRAATLRTQRTRAEREFLEDLLHRHRGNAAAAARELAITRQGFHKALRRTGLG